MHNGAICFRVVKEPYGWAVRMGEGMMTPFRSRGMAIEHANGFVTALRARGESAELILDDAAARAPDAARYHHAAARR